MPLRIEDYALIGDCETAALVGRDGSIDWLCLPRFDSDSCFAALLGDVDNGRWKVAPLEASEITRRYRDDTLILETTFKTSDGTVLLIDFMPPKGKYSDVMRTVIGIDGTVHLRSELVVRFNYGLSVPWVTGPRSGILCAIAGQTCWYLRPRFCIEGKA